MAKAKEKTKTVTIYNYAKSDLAPAIASIAKLQNELAELQRVADLSIAKIQTDLAANSSTDRRDSKDFSFHQRLL